MTLGRERGHMIGVEVNRMVVRGESPEYRGVPDPGGQKRDLSGEAHK